MTRECRKERDRRCLDCSGVPNCAAGLSCENGAVSQCHQCEKGHFPTEFQVVMEEFTVDVLLGRNCSSCSHPFGCPVGSYEARECDGLVAGQDRICTPCNESCGSGYYEAVTCSRTTNRLCEICQPIARCVRPVTCDSGEGSSCAECSTGFFVSKLVGGGNGGGDRCEACRAPCDSGTFQVADCSVSADRVCQLCDPVPSCLHTPTCDGERNSKCSSCESGFYLQPGDTNSDVCVACTAECEPGSFESNACTTTSDRECRGCPAIANCAVRETCTTSSDVLCSECLTGYYKANTDGGTDVCTLCSPRCSTGYFESVACFTESNRVCQLLNYVNDDDVRLNFEISAEMFEETVRGQAKRNGRRLRTSPEQQRATIGARVVDELERITGQRGSRFIVSSVEEKGGEAEDKDKSVSVLIDIGARQEVDGELEAHTTDLIANILTSQQRRLTAHPTIVTNQVAAESTTSSLQLLREDSELAAGMAIAVGIAIGLCIYSCCLTYRFRKYILSEIKYVLAQCQSMEEEELFPSPTRVATLQKEATQLRLQLQDETRRNSMARSQSASRGGRPNRGRRAAEEAGHGDGGGAGGIGGTEVELQGIEEEHSSLDVSVNQPSIIIPDDTEAEAMEGGLGDPDELEDSDRSRFLNNGRMLSERQMGLL